MRDKRQENIQQTTGHKIKEYGILSSNLVGNHTPDNSPKSVCCREQRKGNSKYCRRDIVVIGHELDIRRKEHITNSHE